MTTITIDRAMGQQMLEMLCKVEAELKTYYTTETEEVRALYASITALRAALAQQAEPLPAQRVHLICKTCMGIGYDSSGQRCEDCQS